MPGLMRREAEAGPLNRLLPLALARAHWTSRAPIFISRATA